MTPEQSLASRFQRNDVLTGCEDHLTDGHHALLSDGFADYGERLLAHFAIRHDVVRTVEVQLVDLLLGDELINIDCPLALNRDCFQLFRRKLKVFALSDLVALDDVGGFDLIAGISIDLAVFDAMPGVLVELVEADLLALARRWEKRDWDTRRETASGSLSNKREGPRFTPYTERRSY